MEPATIFCCLPFATGIIGAGVAAFGARFAPFQPYLMGTSFALAYSFYQAYRPDPTCAAGGCNVPASVRRRRIVLWVVAVAVVALVTRVVVGGLADLLDPVNLEAEL